MGHGPACFTRAITSFLPPTTRPRPPPSISTRQTGTTLDPTTGIATYPKAYVGLMVPNTGNLNNGIVYVNTPGYPQGTTYGNGIS